MLTIILLISAIIVTVVGLCCILPNPVIKRTHSQIRKYKSDFDRNSYNGRRVDLTFWNSPRLLSITDSNDYSKIVDQEEKSGLTRLYLIRTIERVLCYQLFILVFLIGTVLLCIIIQYE